MLMIEGPDMIGKTTLCEELVKILNRDYDAEFDSTKFGLIDSRNMVAAHAEKDAPRRVADRGFLSEVIYGSTVPGREPSLSPADVDDLVQDMVSRNGIIVVFHAASESLFGNQSTYARVVEERYRDAPQDFTRTECCEVNRAYGGFCRSWSLGGYRVPIAASFESYTPLRHADEVARLYAAVQGVARLPEINPEEPRVDSER